MEIAPPKGTHGSSGTGWATASPCTITVCVLVLTLRWPANNVKGVPGSVQVPKHGGNSGDPAAPVPMTGQTP